MPAASLTDYAGLLLAMPGTARQLSRRTGIGTHGMRVLLRRFLHLGLAFPALEIAAGNIRESVWQAGSGRPCNATKPLRPHAGHIAFSYLWREFEGGATTAGAAKDCGMSKGSALRLLRYLRSRGQAHISGWERDAHNRPVAVWTLGPGVNMAKPVISGVARNRAMRQRRRELEALQMRGAA